MWKKTYPYMSDADFLIQMDLQHLQNHYIKLTLLDWDENPIREIQGLATGGSISLNGDSAVRRTCSLSMAVEDLSQSAITSTKNLISINKKVYLEVGVSNNTNKYREEYPIVWYPEGLYVVTDCNISSSLGAPTTISLQLKDKMCLLNGECGGVIAATTQFDRWDTIDANGNWITMKPTIATIIREAVNHLGGEQLGRILISDIDEKVKQRIRWIGNNPVYLINRNGSYFLTTNKSEGVGAGIQTFEYGDDIGFIYTDFIYPDELIANPGDNIATAVLDKIKSFLGNFEYFYDVYGNFRFQEIKDYLKTTQATTVINQLNNKDYKIDIAKGKAVYDFSDNKLSTSFSNSPQYNRIKNDFVIWGVRKGTNDTEYPIRYHLAIDQKPKIGNIYEVYFYTDPDDNLRKAKAPIPFESMNKFPKEGNVDNFYLDKSSNVVYKWDNENLKYVSMSGNQVYEYNTFDDLPKTPDKDAIYVTLDTKTSYQWLPNPNSQHYEEYQQQKEQLKTEYENAAAAIQNRISAVESLIDDVKNQIADLDADYKPYLDELNSFTIDLDNMIDAKNNYTNQIEQYESVISDYQKELQELETQYSNYMDLAEAAQEEEEQNRYYALAEKVQDQMTTIEQRIDSVQSEIDEQQGKSNSLDSQMKTFKAYIQEVNEKLTEYYDKSKELNAKLQGYQDRLTELKNQLEELTKKYQDDLAKIEYNQCEYTPVAGGGLVKVQATDWRSELYLQGVSAEALGLQTNYYWTELKAEWPKLYNLTASSYTNEDGETIYTGAFYDGVLERPWDLDYWLDFIDSDAAIGELSVNNIGRRTFSESKDDYNHLFEPEVPDFIIIESGQDDTEEQRKECEKRAQKYIQVDPNIYESTATGLTMYGCFERVKECLYDYTSYNNAISISCIPIYHLEPNTRITVTSKENDIHGDHLINSMSIPLTIDGAMSISATQCNAKL